MGDVVPQKGPVFIVIVETVIVKVEIIEGKLGKELGKVSSIAEDVSKIIVHLAAVVTGVEITVDYKIVHIHFTSKEVYVDVARTEDDV